MTLSPELNKKYLVRFDQLIQDGAKVLGTIHLPSGDWYYSCDEQALEAWHTSSFSLFDQILPPGHIHRALFEELAAPNERNYKGIAVKLLAKLKAVKSDLEGGFIGNLSARIEAEISADYMGQAERLLAEGQSGKFDHVPAAVLAGAVLEKALRGMCERQRSPIPTVKDNGEPKALNAMIDDLKKADAYNELKAKQLRAWAAVRNHAAHGEFDQFKREDVEQMLKGITNFLGEFAT